MINKPDQIRNNGAAIEFINLHPMKQLRNGSESIHQSKKYLLNSNYNKKSSVDRDNMIEDLIKSKEVKI